ncbi:unnamed protein product [Rangifer tarandus platyrhynchus]|uniref:Uncharacterized protein n=2 Tax=Rangifer tarandus platyrhynchus TaxID=3082113 RepID=A0ACB0FD74_RANTA|nr:unnamed protein product [Rangifer tarandus platyrhynchus]CAI9710899.1 unnamed protein product [Rangifer tarandus platyrhynchus]
MVMATFHELLHALGFSGWLFQTWRDCLNEGNLRENCSTKQVTRRDEWRQLLSTTAWPSTWNCRRLTGCFLGSSSENENSLGSWKEEGAVKCYLLPWGPLSSHWEVNHSTAEVLFWGWGLAWNLAL